MKKKKKIWIEWALPNFKIESPNFPETTEEMAARGSVVVEALCYKPGGPGFETRCGE
jgi:hypothetical protein